MTGDNVRRVLRAMSPDNRRLLDVAITNRLGSEYDPEQPMDAVLEAIRLDIIDSDMEDIAIRDDLGDIG